MLDAEVRFVAVSGRLHQAESQRKKEQSDREALQLLYQETKAQLSNAESCVESTTRQLTSQQQHLEEERHRVKELEGVLAQQEAIAGRTQRELEEVERRLEAERTERAHLMLQMEDLSRRVLSAETKVYQAELQCKRESGDRDAQQQLYDEMKALVSFTENSLASATEHSSVLERLLSEERDQRSELEAMLAQRDADVSKVLQDIENTLGVLANERHKNSQIQMEKEDLTAAILSLDSVIISLNHQVKLEQGKLDAERREHDEIKTLLGTTESSLTDATRYSVLQQQRLEEEQRRVKELDESLAQQLVIAEELKKEVVNAERKAEIERNERSRLHRLSDDLNSKLLSAESQVAQLNQSVIELKHKCTRLEDALATSDAAKEELQSKVALHQGRRLALEEQLVGTNGALDSALLELQRTKQALMASKDSAGLGKIQTSDTEVPVVRLAQSEIAHAEKLVDESSTIEKLKDDLVASRKQVKDAEEKLVRADALVSQLTSSLEDSQSEIAALQRLVDVVQSLGGGSAPLEQSGSGGTISQGIFNSVKISSIGSSEVSDNASDIGSKGASFNELQQQLWHVALPPDESQEFLVVTMEARIAELSSLKTEWERVAAHQRIELSDARREIESLQKQVCLEILLVIKWFI